MDDTLVFYGTVWGGLLIIHALNRYEALRSDVTRLQDEVAQLRSQVRAELRSYPRA